MIEVYKRTLSQEKLERLTTFEKGSWLRVIAPTDDEISTLMKSFNLDGKTLHDSLDDDEFPRMESDEGRTYIIINVPTEIDGKVTTIPFTVILTEANIITVSMMELGLTQDIIEGKKELFTTQKVKFMLNIFLKASKLYDSYMNRISKDIRAKRHRLKNLSDDDIVRLVEHEEILNEFLFSFVPTVRIMNRLLDGKTLKLYRDDRELIEDLVINAEQTLDLCKLNLKTITNVRDAYSAVLTNNLNARIKLLTIMTVALTIPTIVASIYGMNVHLPMQDDPHSFYFVLLIAIVILVMFLSLFKLRKWI